MKASRNVTVPSHTLYADDIILFSRGSISMLDSIANLLSLYADGSGKVCNLDKSVIYAGSIST